MPKTSRTSTSNGTRTGPLPPGWNEVVDAIGRASRIDHPAAMDALAALAGGAAAAAALGAALKRIGTEVVDTVGLDKRVVPMVATFGDLQVRAGEQTAESVAAVLRAMEPRIDQFADRRWGAWDHARNAQ